MLSRRGLLSSERAAHHQSEGTGGNGVSGVNSPNSKFVGMKEYNLQMEDSVQDAAISGLIIVRNQKNGSKEYHKYQRVPYENMKEEFDRIKAYEKWLEVTWHDGINQSQLEAIRKSYPKDCEIKEIPEGMVIRCNTSCTDLYFSR